MTWSWKGFCTVCAFAGATCLCVVTGGAAAPLVSAVAAPYVIGGAVATGYFIGDAADKESIEREKTLIQDQRYKDATSEADKQAQINNQNQTLIQEIAGKINGKIPRQPHETDEYLNQQLVIAQSNLKTGESRLNKLRKDVDKLRKDLGGGGSLVTLLGLDKLSFMDKVMIAGGIVLVIYLLKS